MNALPMNALDRGTRQSEALYERLLRVMPAGTTRGAVFFPPFPLALAKGAGPRVWDLDGNEFFDAIYNFTSLVHGHAPPSVIEAITQAASNGTALASPQVVQAELAELICGRFPSIEHVRFTNSGFEALVLAINLARAFTGRDEIVRAVGGYSGYWRDVPARIPPRGVPMGVSRLDHYVNYNDCGELESLMATKGERIAALLFEPVLGGGGIIEGTPEFFRLAEQLARRHSALLIIDEVMTARLAAGGFQSVLGVKGDLTTLGKIIGGGLPIGAVGGRRDVLGLLDMRQEPFIYHSGTYNGNPLSMAAGVETMKMLSAEEIGRINDLGASLARVLNDGLARAGLSGQVTNVGSLLQLHFNVSHKITSYRDTNPHDPLLSQFHELALAAGVFGSRRGMLCTSTAMNDAVTDEIGGRLSSALAELGQRHVA